MSESRVEVLDALELAAFQSSVIRVNRSAFEMRSAEAAHERISGAYLARLGLARADWNIRVDGLDKGVLVLVPIEKPAAAPPEEKPPVPADPPPASPVPPAPQEAALSNPGVEYLEEASPTV
jgi:hypothetical protein